MHGPHANLTENMYAGLMDASQCKTPTPSSGPVRAEGQSPRSVSVCNYISAAVFESELSFLKRGKYTRELVCGLLRRKKKNWQQTLRQRGKQKRLLQQLPESLLS